MWVKTLSTEIILASTYAMLLLIDVLLVGIACPYLVPIFNVRLNMGKFVLLSKVVQRGSNIF